MSNKSLQFFAFFYFSFQVPSEVSHADFWARYFYKVHQLELDEARKMALMKRAEQTREESFSWDDGKVYLIINL